MFGFPSPPGEKRFTPMTVLKPAQFNCFILQ